MTWGAYQSGWFQQASYVASAISVDWIDLKILTLLSIFFLAFHVNQCFQRQNESSFWARKKGYIDNFKSRNVGEGQTIEVLYWLVCSAISQFTIFHPCPISGWWLQWILYPPDHRTLTVERCQDVVMVHIAKSCRLQNRIFSIYPNLSGIALMFLLNVFCPFLSQ